MIERTLHLHTQQPYDPNPSFGSPDGASYHVFCMVPGTPLEAANRETLVVIADAPDNSGTSLTNNAENVVKAVARMFDQRGWLPFSLRSDMRRATWIEVDSMGRVDLMTPRSDEANDGMGIRFTPYCSTCEDNGRALLVGRVAKLGDASLRQDFLTWMMRFAVNKGQPDFMVSRPEWATAPASDYLTAGAYLCSRDSRRHGNAVVFRVLKRAKSTVARVVTDMGAEMTMTAEELERDYFPPRWRMAPDKHPGVMAMLQADKAGRK